MDRYNKTIDALDRFLPRTMSIDLFKTVILAIFMAGETFEFPTPVVPESTITQVGAFVRFNCSSHLNESIYWSRTPFGLQNTYEIYLDGDDELLNGYPTPGRYSVIEDLSQRRYDLIIENVSKSDAGNYICTDQLGLGKRPYAELVVTDGLECEEMSSSDGYVGDNVFDLKQDIVRFLCRMNYTGNLRPVLDWFQGQSTEAVSSDTTWDPSSNVLSSKVALVATSNLNGIPVKCKARLTTNDVLQEAVQTAQVAWTSKPIYVKYAVLKQKEMKNCPGLEWTLDCNPPCLHQLQYNYSTSSPACHVTYTTGNSTYTQIFKISNGRSRYFRNSNRLTIALTCMFIIVSVICATFIILYIKTFKSPPTDDPEGF